MFTFEEGEQMTTSSSAIVLNEARAWKATSGLRCTAIACHAPIARLAIIGNGW